jgi:hypothetical protein
VPLDDEELWLLEPEEFWLFEDDELEPLELEPGVDGVEPPPPPVVPPPVPDETGPGVPWVPLDVPRLDDRDVPAPLLDVCVPPGEDAAGEEPSVPPVPPPMPALLPAPDEVPPEVPFEVESVEPATPGAPRSAGASPPAATAGTLPAVSSDDGSVEVLEPASLTVRVDLSDEEPPEPDVARMNRPMTTRPPRVTRRSWAIRRRRSASSAPSGGTVPDGGAIGSYAP